MSAAVDPELLQIVEQMILRGLSSAQIVAACAAGLPLGGRKQAISERRAQRYIHLVEQKVAQDGGRETAMLLDISRRAAKQGKFSAAAAAVAAMGRLKQRGKVEDGGLLSLRAFARHRKEAGLSGGSLRAVQVAIQTGRLARSVVLDSKGEKKISDAAAADAEWAASTNEDRVPLSGPTAPAVEGDSFTPLSAARARKAAAEAEVAELELAERRGQLVRADEVEARLVRVFVNCRTKLLDVPSRAFERDPSLSEDQVALVDSLIHEALEDLAVGGVPGEGQPPGVVSG